MTAIANDLPAIEITPAGRNEDEQEGVLKSVQPSPGYPTAVRLLADAIDRESMTTILDFTPKAASVRFWMDGIWQPGPVLDRESADFMLATLKRIAGLNHLERRLKQEGKFNVLYKKLKRNVRVLSQGIPSGERVAIYLDWKRPILESVDQLGMRSSMQQQLAGVLNNPQTGLVLVAAAPGEGYTTAWRGVLNLSDRLVRDFFVVEEASLVEPEVINFFSVAFDRSKGENAMTPITQLLLRQPDVLAFSELPDADTIDSVVQLSTDKKMPIFLRSPGKSCLDALLRLVAMGPKVQEMVHRLDALVCMRLIRLLCGNCKIPFQPHPQLLQKLGIPAGRVGNFFQPYVFKPGTLDENEKEILPCPACQGIGFRGQTGLFELLLLNDPLREEILRKPQLQHLQNFVQSQGHVSLQQEGIVLVAKGVTSLDELQRVLKA